MLKELKYALLLFVLPPVVYIILVILRATFRIEHVNKEPVDRLWEGGGNIIACFWHGRLLAMPFAYKGSKGKVLISRHRDGEFIARVIRYFGVGTVRGSYRKGSVSSIREILSELREGTDIGITPDGPRGPRYQVKQGIIELARLARKPIVPVTYSADKKKLFRSWDCFLLPYPFSKIIFLWGDPVFVPEDVRGQELEQRRRELEGRLIALTEAADRMVCGD
jgi:lysophospholipid acyltransferase (LPLAT)-like uncharacterized protein